MSNMQTFAAVIFIVAALSCAQAGTVPHSKEEVKAIMTKCMEETKATEDIDKLIETHSLPTSDNGKCMLACVLREKGLLKDDTFDADAVKRQIETKFSGDSEKMQQALKVIAECSVEDYSGLDMCEKVYKMVSCGKEKNFPM